MHSLLCIHNEFKIQLSWTQLLWRIALGCVCENICTLNPPLSSEWVSDKHRIERFMNSFSESGGCEVKWPHFFKVYIHIYIITTYIHKLQFSCFACYGLWQHPWSSLWCCISGHHAAPTEASSLSIYILHHSRIRYMLILWQHHLTAQIDFKDWGLLTKKDSHNLKSFSVLTPWSIRERIRL